MLHIKLLVYCAQNGHKKKTQRNALKAKYEALKELDKNRPTNKVAIQFHVPGNTLSTWEKTKKKSTKLFKTHY